LAVDFCVATSSADIVEIHAKKIAEQRKKKNAEN
jgi:hypothetical protein